MKKLKKKPKKNLTINRSAKKKSTKKRSLKKNLTVKKSFRKKSVKKILIPKKESLALKIVKLQHSLKPEFKIKINFSLEKYIQTFFDMIADTILDYKILKAEDKRKR